MAEDTNVEQAEYPMPVKDKPLKIDGASLEYILLVPKGVEAKYPTPPEGEAGLAETDKAQEEKISELNESIKTLEAEKATLTEERDTLHAELSAIHEADKNARVTSFVEERIKLGITPKEEMEKEVEKFVGLSDEELNIVEEEFKKVSVKLSNIVNDPKAQYEDELKSQVERRGLAGD